MWITCPSVARRTVPRMPSRQCSCVAVVAVIVDTVVVVVAAVVAVIVDTVVVAVVAVIVDTVVVVVVAVVADAQKAVRLCCVGCDG